MGGLASVVWLASGLLAGVGKNARSRARCWRRGVARLGCGQECPQSQLDAAQCDDARAKSGRGWVERDNNKSQKSEAEEEEKAEKTEEEKEDIETDDHEQAKREMDKDNSQSPKDPDDSNGAPGVGKHTYFVLKLWSIFCNFQITEKRPFLSHLPPLIISKYLLNAP